MRGYKPPMDQAPLQATDGFEMGASKPFILVMGIAF